MVKKTTLIVLLLCLNIINAQSLQVLAETDSTNYLIGDYINLTVTIKHSDNEEIIAVDAKEAITDLEFIKELTVESNSDGGLLIDSYRFVFSKYDSAKVEIPPINISYRKIGSSVTKSISTEPFTINVSTVAVNLNSDIQDVKAPIKIEMDWLLVLYIFLILLVISGLVYYFYRRKKLRDTDATLSRPIIIIPPHKIALKALYDLQEEKLWQQGLIKEFHSNITEIIRKYFEDQFHFNALEMTSGEVLLNLNDISGSSEIYKDTEEFLSYADLVKFAKFKPMPSVNDKMLEYAFSIVNKTKPYENIEEKQ